MSTLQPATDEDVAIYAECPWGLHGDSVLSLIARIHELQAEVASLEMTIDLLDYEIQYPGDNA